MCVGVCSCVCVLFGNRLASVLACHLLNRPNCDRSPMQTAQKTERQTMKAFSVGVAWLLVSLKHMTGRESDGDSVFVFEPTLTLFAFHYLFSYRRTSKISCHTHPPPHTGCEKIINNASFKAAVKAQHTWRMRNWQHLAEQLVLLLI